MRDDKFIWLLALLLIAAGAGAIWYLRAAPEPAAPVAPAPAAATPEPEPAGPRHPLPQADDESEETPELRPLPALDDSDEYFKLELTDLFGDASADMIVSSGLIERIVATIDNLPRQRVSERIRPLAALSETFVADGQDDSGQYTLDEQNYRRYDVLVEQFVAMDLQPALDLYRRYYPLFQKAYVGLGYPDGYFNDRLVEVIGHLLETPDVDGPIQLVRPHVLYEFANPELEALSGGQKLMLRLGPDNRARVREKLTKLRTLLVDA